MKDNYPLVSVIIPSYNHAGYIEECLASVFGQTYNNIEVIVVDDGSIDNTIEVLASMRRKYIFEYFTQQNMGVCRTLNKGISLAKGKYVAVLASDDYWSTDKVEKQVRVLEGNDNSEFCFTQALEFDGNGRRIRVFPKRTLNGNVVNSVFIRQHVPAGSIMFSRVLYSEVGGFDETLKEEDWDFVIRCAAKTSFSSISEPLLFYRSHTSNIMKTRSRKEIFRQKALLLSKNFHLVNPYVWLLSILIHFLYDNIIKRR
jgi:alpha-1,3-rhamnosyltransferase